MQLLEHFKELTLHPKNAQELKGLILQLAVQGKLTKKWREENPTVEPSGKLLDRIKKHNSEQLARKGRRVKSEKYESELKLDLPQNWIQVRNHELFSLQKGKNPADLSESVKAFPYQDIEALDRGNVRRYSNDKKAPKCTEDDILVVCDGSRSGLVLNGKNGIVGSTLAIIETPPFIKEYIKIIFLQDYQRANENMIGAAIPHLDTKNLLLEIIGLPPLEEQKAIVEVVNQLFAEVEQLEALTKERIQLKSDFVTSGLNQLTQAAEQDTASQWAFLQEHFGTFFTEKENIKKLRESILQLAVQGKLTHHWRSEVRLKGVEVDHASPLLEKIKAEKERQNKAEKKTIKQKPKWDLPIKENEKHFSLPESWEWFRLGDVCELKHGYAFSSDFFTSDPTPYVLTTPGNFHENGGFRDRENKRKYYYGPVNPEFILKPGDLIIPMTEQAAGLLGSPAFIPDNGMVYLHNQRLGKMSFDSKIVLPEFSFLFFNSSFFRNELARTCTGIKVRHTSPDRVLCVPFPVCTLQEQLCIVEKVNSLMALCDHLEQEIETHQTTQEHWMQSCLREVV
ncbi:restriction endonuclease subunit S [Algoriphagus sp.]|uniref:restriction endonuclease subunit S n=1 Tax=Algoriphagus sp. TaxID=1872435 RepID=UPI002721726F|nr:restriction endonuclease subunit S [Algoriphagus sp.]MDO8968797.1 restriction endonuclease subunit S [Algoriphagus sp.]MDP3199285.1 restriction endonuclease subunit S [Algoriphagus sp.]